MTVEPREHPAKFSAAILKAIAAHVPAGAAVLDPLAGTGRIHQLRELVEGGCDTAAVELEPEWAAWDCRTIVGNALSLPFADGTFDVLATSPTYGNRMADHHVAKDACGTCEGLKWITGNPVCPACKGTGLSRRMTYRHLLGRMPSADSSAVMAWGDEYREFHERCWKEAARALVPCARVILNLKNPATTNGVPKFDLVGWHVAAWSRLGFEYVTLDRVAAQGFRQGANGQQRTGYEVVVVMDRDGGPGCEMAPGACPDCGRWSCGCGGLARAIEEHNAACRICAP